MTPPALEICTWAPLSGKDRTYTSYCPASVLAYASHRPLGEKAANALAGILRNDCGSPARSFPDPLSTGTVRISAPAPGVTSEKTRPGPSRVEEGGNCLALLCVRGCGFPAPSPRLQNPPPTA